MITRKEREIRQLRQQLMNTPTPQGPPAVLRELIEHGRFESVTPPEARLSREQVQANLNTFGQGDQA